MKNLSVIVFMMICIIIGGILGSRLEQVKIEKIINKMIDEKKIICTCSCHKKEIKNEQRKE